MNQTAVVEPAAASEAEDDVMLARRRRLGPVWFAPHTDAGNAEVFAERHGGRVRFDHARQRWLVWAGHRWRPDADGEVYRLAVEAVRARHHTAVDEGREGDALARFARRSEHVGRLEAMLKLTRNLSPIASVGDEWDRSPDLLGVPNGVVDLRSGELRAGEPADGITLSAAVDFDPSAECPRWRRFLDEVFEGDPELVEYVHRAVGYSFTGAIGEDKFFTGFGDGSNGKSTLVETLRRIAGDYGHNLSALALLDERRGAHTTDVADLEGRRFVTASEFGEFARLNESRLKYLTGGDPITARHMRQDNRTFLPTHKLWLMTNHLPTVRDDSTGFWRRVVLVPFNREFEVNDKLDDELAAELAGILAWVVQGAVAWHAQGLGQPPARVTEAVEEYRDEEDPLADFYRSCVVEEEGAWTSTAELYRIYKMWADDQQIPKQERIGVKWFGRRLAKRFKGSGKKDGVRGFAEIRGTLPGWALKPPEEPEQLPVVQVEDEPAF